MTGSRSSQNADFTKVSTLHLSVLTSLFFLTTFGAGSILLQVFVEIIDFHGLDSRFPPLLLIPQQQLNRYSLPKSITGF
jgi:hypothetical protein